MDFIASQMPAIEHLGVAGYWLILLISFAESLALVGEFVPGGILVILAGFLSAQGYLDVGDLIWFAAVGAILGDSASYWLGSKGSRFFRTKSGDWKMRHLEMGEQFFKEHGEKSILLGRFIGPLRPIVPFIAGLFAMKLRVFLFWNIVSGFLWAASYLLLGYFFGSAAWLLEAWTTRAGFFALLSLLAVLLLWFLLKRSGMIYSFLLSVAVSIKDAVIANSEVQKLIGRHPRITTFLTRRLCREKFTGLPLTLTFVAVAYVFSLLFGIVENVITSGPIIAADVRIANLLYAFRESKLLIFFTWVTLLGSWQIVSVGVVVAMLLFWVWKRREYIIPFLVTLIGSEALVLLGKWALHRPRPEIAYYVEHGYSFPSGHATIAVAFWGFLTYALIRETKTWKGGVTILFWGLVVILAIGLSRLYLGVHYVSDVWSGYLSGLLFLLIGIALVEWIKSRYGIRSLTVSRSVKIISAASVSAVIPLYVAFALYYHPPLTAPQHEQIMMVDNVLEPFLQHQLSQYTETLLGNEQEPLTLIIAAKDDATFVDTMERAGWRLADAATLPSVFTLAQSVIFNKPYPAAPMTPSFWNARPHDFGFEKETAAKNVHERHHARFWKTNLETLAGAHVYLGTASFDNGIKWLIAHTISPDIDTERELLFADLQNTGRIASSSKVSFVAPILGENFSGDQFFTDGKAYIITLAN